MFYSLFLLLKIFYSKRKKRKKNERMNKKSNKMSSKLCCIVRFDIISLFFTRVTYCLLFQFIGQCVLLPVRPIELFHRFDVSIQILALGYNKKYIYYKLCYIIFDFGQSTIQKYRNELFKNNFNIKNNRLTFIARNKIYLKIKAIK